MGVEEMQKKVQIPNWSLKPRDTIQEKKKQERPD